MSERRPKKKLPLIGETLPSPSKTSKTGVRARALAHMRNLLAASAVVAACDKTNATREPPVDAARDAPEPVDAAPETGTVLANIVDAGADDAARDASDDASDGAVAKKTGPCDPPTVINAQGQRVCKPACYHKERRRRGPMSDPPGPMPGMKRVPAPAPDPCLIIEWDRDEWDDFK